MIRSRGAAFAQSGNRFTRDKREAFAGRSFTKTSLIPIQSDRILIYCARATRNSPIHRLLVPATERTTDLVVVLLHTCRLKTKREEENAGFMGHRQSWPIFQTGPAGKRSIGGLIAGPASPWPCSTPSSRTQSRYHPVRPTNKKPRIAPGLFEAGCLLQAASVPPSARSVGKMRGLQRVVEHGVQRRGDFSGRVGSVEEAGRRAFLQAGRNILNVVVGIGVFVAGKGRNHG